MSNLIPVCVYCDSTDLYSEEEIMLDNLTDLLFPEEIVRAWYEIHKAEFDEETVSDLGVSKDECSFELWYKMVSTAMDTDGLYEFAESMGFKAERPEEETTMLKEEINWHDIKESPPLYKTLFLITENGALCIGSYRYYDGKLIRTINLGVSDDVLVSQAGSTVLWAELPSREEIEALIYNRKGRT